MEGDQRAPLATTSGHHNQLVTAAPQPVVTAALQPLEAATQRTPSWTFLERRQVGRYFRSHDTCFNGLGVRNVMIFNE